MFFCTGKNIGLKYLRLFPGGKLVLLMCKNCGCSFLIIVFCFSYSGWAVGPSGGVVEPDLVERMKLGGLADGHFSYGPSFLDLPREPFSDERHSFGDGQLHSCEPYLEMERKFFSDNAEIMRENYFDVGLLLGEDPVEDVAVEEAINIDDLVPVRSAEEIQWQIDAANHIASMEIVRFAPADSDSESGGTMERVTVPVVVEAVGETVDAGEAAGFAGVCADNASVLVAAAGGDDVGETVEGGDRVGETVEGVDRVGETVEGGDHVGETAEGGDHVGEAAGGWDEALSGPGPSGGDASMDDFLPRPRPWFFSFLTSSDAAGDEVTVFFLFLIWRSVLLLNC
jgi:hypothetical protein